MAVNLFMIGYCVVQYKTLFAIDQGANPGALNVSFILLFCIVLMLPFYTLDTARTIIHADDTGIYMQHRWTRNKIMWQEIRGWYVQFQRNTSTGQEMAVDFILIGEHHGFGLRFANAMSNLFDSPNPTEQFEGGTEHYVEDAHRLLATIIARTNHPLRMWPHHTGRSTAVTAQPPIV